MGIPGICDCCDRPATSAMGWWDGGAPGVGTYRQRSRCVFHLGDPPGSIPAACWACGLPVDGNDSIVCEHAVSDGVDGPTETVWIAHYHPTCPWGPWDMTDHWDGPRSCSRCQHPIGYGQPRTEHHQPQFNRTLYSHEVCPR